MDGSVTTSESVALVHFQSCARCAMNQSRPGWVNPSVMSEKAYRSWRRFHCIAGQCIHFRFAHTADDHTYSVPQYPFSSLNDIRWKRVVGSAGYELGQ